MLWRKPEPGEEDLGKDDTDEAVIGEKTIVSKRRGRKTHYIYCGKKSELLAGNDDTTMMLLGMYPQLRGAMRSSIEAAMQSIFRNSLSGLSNFASILSKLEHVVHVSNAFPADPAKSETMIREILRAIGEKKKLESAICEPMMGLSPIGWWSLMDSCAVSTIGTSLDCVHSGSKGVCFCC